MIYLESIFFCIQILKLVITVICMPNIEVYVTDVSAPMRNLKYKCLFSLWSTKKQRLFSLSHIFIWHHYSFLSISIMKMHCFGPHSQFVMEDYSYSDDLENFIHNKEKIYSEWLWRWFLQIPPTWRVWN